MPFETPKFSRSQVDAAGHTLGSSPLSADAARASLIILNNWRSSHLYPLNTFQALLRTKLRQQGRGGAAAQRLKRTPSILAKLQRHDRMSLARMQDIVGLRAILPDMGALEDLYHQYAEARFEHELTAVHDHVQDPKPDGYRSVHLVYKYRNAARPEYTNMRLEIQMRTRLQHLWATAVETIDSVEHLNMKGGVWSEKWSEYFLLASAAFALIEETPLPRSLRGMSSNDVRELLAPKANNLAIQLQLIRGYRVVAERIRAVANASDEYHLVVLDVERRVVDVTSFSATRADEAAAALAVAEQLYEGDPSRDAVLVSGTMLDDLDRAFPNYFLDIAAFIDEVRRFVEN